MISTDKAVNPTSVMGASKRVAELIVHRAAAADAAGPMWPCASATCWAAAAASCRPSSTRSQRGGPVTVTDPEMKRYFMTIPEAVQLVLQAAALGAGGEVFMLDMGEPVKIVDLARDLIELSGLQVGQRHRHRLQRLRPGREALRGAVCPGRALHAHGAPTHL